MRPVCAAINLPPMTALPPLHTSGRPPVNNVTAPSVTFITPVTAMLPAPVMLTAPKVRFNVPPMAALPAAPDGDGTQRAVQVAGGGVACYAGAGEGYGGKRAA